MRSRAWLPPLAILLVVSAEAAPDQAWTVDRMLVAVGDGFDTRAFDVRRQRTIYDYARADVDGGDTIPGPLARFFVEQVRRYAGASDGTQRALRVLRSRFMQGEEMSALEADRSALAQRLRDARAWPGDRAAVEAFASEMRAPR